MLSTPAHPSHSPTSFDTSSSSSTSSNSSASPSNPPKRLSFLLSSKRALSDSSSNMTIAASQLQQNHNQQSNANQASSPGASQFTPSTPQGSFTPPSTRPRQLLHNVINTPPHPSTLAQTQLHPQPIRPASPTSFQRTSPPPPPPPPPPINTTGLGSTVPILPNPAQTSSSAYYPPVPSASTSAAASISTSASVTTGITFVSDSNSTSAPSPTIHGEGTYSLNNLQANVSTLSLNSQQQQQQQQYQPEAGEWTIERVVHWLRARPHYAYLEPLFVENQIYGKAFVALTNTTLKTLDPTSSYYQRRKLLMEIKDAVEGTRTATSVSSVGSNNAPTPSPASGSPVLNRLGSGSRQVTMSPGQATHSPYATANPINGSYTALPLLPETNSNHRNSIDQDYQLNSRMYRSPVDEMSGSASATPMVLQPSMNQHRSSIDTLEPLEALPNISDYFAPPTRPVNSPRPVSDPDLRQLPGRLPAQVTIETTEYSHKIPNIMPRQSSIAYSVNALRPNLNIPPTIVPRGSSRDYSITHGFNALQTNKGMSPVSPPSPGGHNYPLNRPQDAPSVPTKNGPSLNERRNNPSVPHIQTQSLVDAHSVSQLNGQRHQYEENKLKTDATVVGGTLGFGRRPSHKRNHSSADPKSIQVTLDNESFKYVDVTGIENAVMLKERIFSKMRILAEKNKYGIFETSELESLVEDPASRGPPLSEKELMDLVQNADNKGTVKFLVTPIIPLILPPDMDILNPKRNPGTQPQHILFTNQGRNSPFQGDIGGHQRERTTDSTHHLYQQDPYMAFMHPTDDLWGSVHPNQPYPDPKRPHTTARYPLQASNGSVNTSPFGSYQQTYRYGDNPHNQGDETWLPTVGTNSAKTSPRFGPVINTSMGRIHKSGANSPSVDGNMNHSPSPLSGKRVLARNPNLSLVIGSNTDQDGKLVNHHVRNNDRSASPGGSQGYRPPRMANSHDSASPGPNYYEMNRANHPGFGEVPMVGAQGYATNFNSSGLPASPLSAGATKRGSLQPVVKYGSSHSNLNSPRSAEAPRSAEGGPRSDMHMLENHNSHHNEDESENFWGERPPMEFLLENFGRFFQDHDLDHPIIELHPPVPYASSPMVPAQTILGASGSSNALKSHNSPAMTDGWGSSSTMSSSHMSNSPPRSGVHTNNRGSIIHKKSIRVVAQEAKDRLSRQYSGSKVMRRKSTKMWGSRLAEVMPTNQNGPSVGLGMHDYEEELSPIAGSPGVVTRSSIADIVKEAAQEHHIIPESPPMTQEAMLSEDSHENLQVISTSSSNSVLYQQQQQQSQQRVIQVESGKVMDQSQQGIYQNPQSGTIKTFQYLKGGLIGRGSFGRVYHAFNLDTCEMIAIKEVDLPQTLSERNCDRLKTSVEALFSEMEVLKDLDHENIVQYLGFAQNELTANIFLEYVSGGSIESCLKRSGPFPEAVIRFFTRQILLGLEYIHSKKIVHRDIKAANVLVDEQGVCKISDFGISKRNAQSQGGYDENVGSLQGSIFWMAPEMVTSKAYGAKVDIWSFGCLVLEMFTGQQPWKGYAPQQALFTIGSNNAHPPIPENISEEGQRFLARCFTTDANLRPTASELLQDPFAVPPANFNFNDYIEGKITD
ncbi:hypothetical protein BX616_002900 [Lobosporangium transversale]|nr:hypothetical protein BX616_002900 [Lobosporangium transversale]